MGTRGCWDENRGWDGLIHRTASVERHLPLPGDKPHFVPERQTGPSGISHAPVAAERNSVGGHGRHFTRRTPARGGVDFQPVTDVVAGGATVISLERAFGACR